METEERIQAAIRALDAKEITSVRQAARDFNVPRTTLQNRMSGLKPNKLSKQGLQRLNPQEEEALVQAVQQSIAWGWPASIKRLEEMATHMLAEKGDCQPLGRNWYQNFFNRHPELKTLWSRATDRTRKDNTTYDITRNWFNLYQTTKLFYNINDDDIYCMDQKGWMKCAGENLELFVGREQKEAFETQPGSREWVSVIECIGASLTLPPFVVFEGDQIQGDWVDDSIDKSTVIAVSTNGWNDNVVTLSWLQHFEKYTASKTKGVYRLLILDGYSSHTSLEFVRFCHQHKIVALCLPPHSAHYLLPLDVGIAGPLARAYRGLVSQGSDGSQDMNNLQFLRYYQAARNTILPHIGTGWRAAGLRPYDPAKVLNALRPSIPTATLVDSLGRSVTVQGATAERIDALVAELMDQIAPPLMAPV